MALIEHYIAPVCSTLILWLHGHVTIRCLQALLGFHHARSGHGALQFCASPTSLCTERLYIGFSSAHSSANDLSALDFDRWLCLACSACCKQRTSGSRASRHMYQLCRTASSDLDTLLDHSVLCRDRSHVHVLLILQVHIVGS